MGDVPVAFESLTEPIAIVGLACKFGGDARSPEELWKLLVEGRNAWTPILPSRFNSKGIFHPDPDKLDTMHVTGGHFIQEDIALFDAPFFNSSAQLAASLDPQFRLQLESVYEALENAGLSISHVAGSNTSVHASIWKNDYRDGIINDEQNLPRSLETGTGGAFAAGRISHFFDLRVASMTVDTACSTSVVALHQAIHSLRSGEADMSIVGGSNLTLSPSTFVALGSAGLLSPDGKSYAFDSRGNGYGRGEGIATLVIKRLKDAIAAGDPVRAVIRETLLNQDGKKDSITSPNQAAQTKLMRDCYKKAGLHPLDTQYFEAHGTGTKVGDPIEVGAIASVFQPGRPSDQPLRIGSVKTNIGHTEVTSGLAGIIKVVLSMEDSTIPPSINFVKVNPELNLTAANIEIVREAIEWQPGPNGVRRASINSFGYSGTNAHVIFKSADSFVRPTKPPLAYCFDRFCLIHEDCPPSLKEDSIRTRLPTPEENFQSGQPIHMEFLSEALTRNDQISLPPFARCVVLNSLFAQCILQKRNFTCGAVPMSNDTHKLWSKYTWLALTIDSISPALEEAYGASEAWFPEQEAFARFHIQRFRENSFPNDRLPYKGDAKTPPGNPVRATMVFTTKSTKSLIALCKSNNMTVTTAVMSALGQAVFGLADIDNREPKREQHDFTFATSVNVRPKLQSPYHSRAHAAQTCVAGTGCRVRRGKSLIESAQSLHAHFKSTYEDDRILDSLRAIYHFNSDATPVNQKKKEENTVNGAKDGVSTNIPNGVQATSVNAPPLPPSNITISSLGIIDKYFAGDYGQGVDGKPLVSIRKYNFGIEMMTRQMVTYVGTFKGKLQVFISYNDKYYDEDVPMDILERIKKALAEGLGLALKTE